jgi:hypothetical protein
MRSSKSKYARWFLHRRRESNRKDRKEHKGNAVYVVQREAFAFFVLFAILAVQSSAISTIRSR